MAWRDVTRVRARKRAREHVPGFAAIIAVTLHRRPSRRRRHRSGLSFARASAWRGPQLGAGLSFVSALDVPALVPRP